MVDYRALQMIFCPLDGVGVGSFASQEQGFEAGQIVVLEEFAVRVLPLNGANGRGCGEHSLDLVALDQAPIGGGIRGTHGLALKHHGRRSPYQRAVDDI